MSELTSFYISESAEQYWPSASIRTDRLAQNARVAADFIFSELSGLIALPTATIPTGHLPVIRQMQASLSDRTARISSAPPAIRTAHQQIARAEQIAVRMNSLRIAHTLPTISNATQRIRQAASAADAAIERGDPKEAERLARMAAAEAAEMERQVQTAVENRSQAMARTGDGIARAAGLFTAMAADEAIAHWIRANRSEEAGVIAARIREAHTAYASENYPLAMTLAQEIAARSTTLADTAQTGISQRQQEANARAAAQTVVAMGFGARIENMADGAIRVNALDQDRIALDITIQSTGEALIDSHTHNAYSGAACSVVVGKFLAAYRERVRLTEVSRSLVGTDSGPGKGTQRTTRSRHRQTPAAEILRQSGPRQAQTGGTPPPAVVTAWNRLKH